MENLKSRFPKQVAVLAGDVCDFSLAKQAVDIALENFGKLDSLVVNQGTLQPVSRIAEVDLNDFRKAFDVNLFSAVAFVRLRFRI